MKSAPRTLVDVRRSRSRNTQSVMPGAVVYWMQRDQRVNDNWALVYAQEQARTRGVPLHVVFNLVPVFGMTTFRHYDFMLRGLSETEVALRALGIPFHLLRGLPTESIPTFVAQLGAGEVVVDFNPLRFTSEWRTKVGALLPVALTEVDAHNIVPAWVVSPKEEFAAYTFRPKIHRLLPEFLVDFPAIEAQVDVSLPASTDWHELLATVETDRTVAPVSWITPGADAARECLMIFVDQRLSGYAEARNDPNREAQSNLSPYLHFGQLSAQRVALTVAGSSAVPKADRDAYLEELIVRRELADNYCLYNTHYDRVAGAHAWAQQTIREHACDRREFMYERTLFERGETHDELWNAMQRQLTETGKLHGWCRMYWAKKILEWTPDVQTAIDYALYLNDRYELDGSDPNGVVGVMWSIAGVHDRAWNVRPVFGKIRYMNYAGAKRKFDVAAYVAKHSKGTLFS
jgi:deoxyribodipyrimidine photo-lyase